MLNNKNYLLFFIQISVFFLPISFLVGSLIVNINIIIFILLSLTYLIFKKIKVNFNLSNLSLLGFFLILIFSSYKEIDQIGFENFLKSIFLLKFYLLYILIETLIFQKKINTKYFFNTCLILSILLSLDLSLQFFYGKNILGYEPWHGRITGIFKDEAIAGSYIQKIFVFSMISLFGLFFPLNKTNSLIVFLTLSLIIFGSFIANNRISFFVLISFIIILIFSLKIFRKNLILVILFLLPVFYYFYLNDTQTNRKFVGFFSMTKSITVSFKEKIISPKINKGDAQIKSKDNNLPLSKKKTNHEKLFLTSFESFKENILLGNGHKSFRFKCQKFAEKNSNFLCSTHPHNYHLEVIHDTGILGLISLSIFVFSLLITSFKKLFSSKFNYDDKIILSLLIINFLLIIFPLKSTGSLFTTWNGTLLWLTISLINYGNQKSNN